ncbi:MAG: hypothetical protein ACJ74R_13625 [Gaiellaceae bacterium]
MKDGHPVDHRRERFVVPGGIVSFGQGARGAVYAVSQNGNLYRLAA